MSKNRSEYRIEVDEKGRYREIYEGDKLTKDDLKLFLKELGIGVTGMLAYLFIEQLSKGAIGPENLNILLNKLPLAVDAHLGSLSTDIIGSFAIWGSLKTMPKVIQNIFGDRPPTGKYVLGENNAEEYRENRDKLIAEQQAKARENLKK